MARKTEQWKCATPAIDVIDWHDWLAEAKKWHDLAQAGGTPYWSVKECEAASWRCLLRWASRIEFFNED